MTTFSAFSTMRNCPKRTMNKVESLCRLAAKGAHSLAVADTNTKNAMLCAVADALVAEADGILRANARDLDAFCGTDSVRDRLTLTEARISAMAEGVRQVADLADPVGEVIEQFDTPKGLKVRKIRVPLGVIGVIYEARPNVTADVLALTLKSGNAVVLRGGKEAIHTNTAIFAAIKDGLMAAGFETDFVQFIDDTSRESSAELLKQDKYVDVIIPRGGEGLKKFVLANTTIPVIASAGGVCHTYVEKTADLDMAKRIVMNAKLSRPSVCNALECLVVDREIAGKFLGSLLPDMASAKGLVAYGDQDAVNSCNLVKLGDGNVYSTEYLGYAMSVKVVDGVDQAIAHVNAYNTRHSEAIISRDEAAIAKFQQRVDAACVYANTSTRFTDGFEFGFGAEIAISTQKLHARGPLGLKQLTSYKYVIDGNGEIRE